jgi:hypothetical protein
LLSFSDGSLGALKADATVGAVAKRLGRRAPAAAESDTIATAAEVVLVAVSIEKPDRPFHSVRPIVTDRDLNFGHARLQVLVTSRYTIRVFGFCRKAEISIALQVLARRRDPLRRQACWL